VGRNLTVHLDDETILKAKVLAARRSTSVSKLVAVQIEQMVTEDDGYRLAESVALPQIERGFHLGGGAIPDRDSLHER
jgi:hypothetical protein